MFFTTIALSVVSLVLIIFLVRGMEKKQKLSKHEYLHVKKEGIID